MPCLKLSAAEFMDRFSDDNSIILIGVLNLISAQFSSKKKTILIVRVLHRNSPVERLNSNLIGTQKMIKNESLSHPIQAAEWPYQHFHESGFSQRIQAESFGSASKIFRLKSSRRTAAVELGRGRQAELRSA